MDPPPVTAPVDQPAAGPTDPPVTAPVDPPAPTPENAPVPTPAPEEPPVVPAANPPPPPPGDPPITVPTDPTVTFESVVTLDSRACHPACYRAQLNRFVLNGVSTEPGEYYKPLKGDQAGTQGTCGSDKTWGHCVLSLQNGSPAAPTDFVSVHSLPVASPDVDWKAIVVTAVGQAINIAETQRFQDGNDLTALVSMFEMISSAGIHVRYDVNLFRLYVFIKCLSEDVGELKKLTPAESKMAVIGIMNRSVFIQVTTDQDQAFAAHDEHPKGSLIPVAFNEWGGLAQSIKQDLQQQLQEVLDFKTAMDQAIAAGNTDEDKRKILQDRSADSKQNNPKMFARFTWLYPTYSRF
ncbi:hypothetical protein DL96DRAFT_1558199 [Flagelloscypha sp. PMI_526]|nr:hypothetical protein DL96DRAFT_1558199 [Flagelloscypha sp. PMI_526]